ncbi:carbohydrate ABC transporter permease [Sedimentibacter sp. MB31-C6]|uniref:carbohydrate ABC transporter permease n=1 Tax=Sedimentibacter sp. MB31-C6 TaxID=3109366 RepID=UPI002DDCEBDA|nr:sugar ABC transporter permease [Sedimentibacter sp. MB36-C1]WSI03682.1 sugar ABC transporter permease [Sedimentibacter sp. MB36-C1]
MKTLTKKNNKSISYAKWGYIFLIPFFTIYIVFSLVPIVSTIYYSFFENYMSGLKQIGPSFIGLENYKSILFESDLPKYAFNTLFIWIIGFIPQIVVSMTLAIWFTNMRLKLKFTSFFKTVIYMPNLIMAAAFAMLFWALFSDIGPINNLLIALGYEPYSFMLEIKGTRGLIALMNFLMWFGNTTILLMAGIMGIDSSIFEAAQIDGANAWQTFWHVTIPSIKPILVYVFLTSLIGGIQMFDVPQILTNGSGGPNRTSMTMIMFLNKHLFSKNYGMAGALSVILFIVTAILSVIIYNNLTEKDSNLSNTSIKTKGGAK